MITGINNTISEQTRKQLTDLISDYYSKNTLSISEGNIDVTREFLEKASADQLIAAYLYLQSGREIWLAYRDQATYMARSANCLIGIEPDGYIHS